MQNHMIILRVKRSNGTILAHHETVRSGDTMRAIAAVTAMLNTADQEQRDNPDPGEVRSVVRIVVDDDPAVTSERFHRAVYGAEADKQAH